MGALLGRAVEVLRIRVRVKVRVGVRERGGNWYGGMDVVGWDKGEEMGVEEEEEIMCLSSGSDTEESESGEVALGAVRKAVVSLGTLTLGEDASWRNPAEKRRIEQGLEAVLNLGREDEIGKVEGV